MLKRACEIGANRLCTNTARFRSIFPFSLSSLNFLSGAQYFFYLSDRFFFDFSETLQQDSNLSHTKFWLWSNILSIGFLRDIYENWGDVGYFDDICHIRGSLFFPTWVTQFSKLPQPRNVILSFMQVCLKFLFLFFNTNLCALFPFNFN